MIKRDATWGEEQIELQKPRLKVNTSKEGEQGENLQENNPGVKKLYIYILVFLLTNHKSS